MESSSPRWVVRCDHCGAGGTIGAREGGVDAWCEACQRGSRLPAGTSSAPCGNCGGDLSLDRPRFLEAWGEIQHLIAVLASWGGDPGPLGAILPERPRFLTDLTPPDALEGDSADVAAALDAVRSGAWTRSLPLLIAALSRTPGDPRLWRARAIAEERVGEPAAAEESWSRLLERGEDPGARLARGALRARRGSFESAREDFARAGRGREANWDRAALRVLEAVAVTPGLPAPEVIAAARAEAGPASEYWSDHTVGRLLWSLLVERALWRARRDAPACPDERVLRAAEAEIEHDTFWDRALVLHGYASLGLRAEAAAAALPLAREGLDALSAEPFLRARGAEPIRARVAAAREGVAAGDPARALEALRPLLEREDLRRYGVPCSRCGEGTLFAEQLDEV